MMLANFNDTFKLYKPGYLKNLVITKRQVHQLWRMTLLSNNFFSSQVLDMLSKTVEHVN